jgi:ketosteroid isomerase-like protein
MVVSCLHRAGFPNVTGGEEGAAMTHPNEDLIRRGYDAFSSGDMHALQELMTPDVVWHNPGRNPLSGDYEGIDAILELFARAFEASSGTLRLELHDVLANDEHGVGLHRSIARRGGKTLDSRWAMVLHIRDGKVTEVWGHPADQHAEDRFWSSPRSKGLFPC